MILLKRAKFFLFLLLGLTCLSSIGEALGPSQDAEAVSFSPLKSESTGFSAIECARRILMGTAWREWTLGTRFGAGAHFAHVITLAEGSHQLGKTLNQAVAENESLVAKLYKNAFLAVSLMPVVQDLAFPGRGLTPRALSLGFAAAGTLVHLGLSAYEEWGQTETSVPVLQNLKRFLIKSHYTFEYLGSLSISLVLCTLLKMGQDAYAA